MKKSSFVILPAIMVALAGSFFQASAPAASLTNLVTAAGLAPYIRNAFVHDPSTIIKCKDEFWVFTTGRGVPSWHSKDLAAWKPGPAIFTSAPPWVAETVPANINMAYWAPDVAFLDGRYLLYYAVSTGGKRVSGIGLVTSPTLDPGDPAYKWTEAGLVIATTAHNDFNAIDPAILHDTDGSLWLAFGSYWSGIKLIQLDPRTGMRIAPDSPLYSLAHSKSIEASYIYQHGGSYYLFVDWGACCRGTNSTYTIVVGRSQKVTGPYLDMDGKDMLDGGGTIFLGTTGPYVGPGHAGIIEDNGKFWFSCHFEGVVSAATSTVMTGTVTTGAMPWPRRRSSPLAVMPMHWRADGWPEVDLSAAH